MSGTPVTEKVSKQSVDAVVSHRT